MLLALNPKFRPERIKHLSDRQPLLKKMLLQIMRYHVVISMHLLKQRLKTARNVSSWGHQSGKGCCSSSSEVCMLSTNRTGHRGDFTSVCDVTGANGTELGNTYLGIVKLLLFSFPIFQGLNRTSLWRWSRQRSTSYSWLMALLTSQKMNRTVLLQHHHRQQQQLKL